MVVQERMDGAMRYAAHRRALRLARTARPPTKVRLGMALIRLGRWLMGQSSRLCGVAATRVRAFWVLTGWIYSVMNKCLNGILFAGQHMPGESWAVPKGQVLIVDDYRTSLEGMGAALERDFRVLLAEDCKTADSLLSREPVSLVILDVVLRQESGLVFLDLLRKKSDVPVLLISGYGTKEMVIAGMRSRANDYLDKPFTTTQLREKVRELIAVGPQPSHIADRIRDFIQQQYMQDWTVDQLARALHLSVRTMRRVFLRKFGRQPSDFLEEVRIANARELLATTDSSIQAVASQVGFRDAHYFTRVFRQHVGKCPRGFRTDQRHDLDTHN